VKIQLPDGRQHTLDENVSLKQKLEVVEDLVNEWMPIIQQNWNSNSIKFFLDSLSNYLVWHKEQEEKGLEDKKVLSRKKLEKMSKFKKTSKTVNFTDLSSKDNERLFGETRGAE
jgi:hypothetical protein